MDKKFVVDKINFTPCKFHSDKIGSYRILSENNPTIFLCESCYQKFAEKNNFSMEKNQDFTIPQNQKKFSEDGELLFKTSSVANISGHFSSDNWGDFGKNRKTRQKQSKRKVALKSAGDSLVCYLALTLGESLGEITYRKISLKLMEFNNRIIGFSALDNPIAEFNEDFVAIKTFDFSDDWKFYLKVNGEK